MLSIQEFEKAKGLVKQIKQLDNEIVKLERSVLDMINGVSKFEISMHFIKEKQNIVNIENVVDNYLLSGGINSLHGFSFLNATPPTPKSNIEETKFNVNEELSLKIIELYAKELIKHRQSLIIQLEKYNVSI